MAGIKLKLFFFIWTNNSTFEKMGNPAEKKKTHTTFNKLHPILKIKNTIYEVLKENNSFYFLHE